MDEFDRLFGPLASHGAPDIVDRINEISSALQVLTHSPLIGRKAHAGRREPVIGRGSRGCVALYRYVQKMDTVFSLSIRNQREADCR
ncbi:MAG: type II toxin-antitoxin system RelE/ParE family toxin [Betaproteobacteria bacterium]|jgi:hypothetical protein